MLQCDERKRLAPFQFCTPLAVAPTSPHQFSMAFLFLSSRISLEQSLSAFPDVLLMFRFLV
jgi:hypothetical protein